MLVLGLICLILFTTVVNVTADCPAGFVEHQYSCYKLFNNNFTWPEAYSFCHAFNTHLLTLEDEAELTFIKTKAAEVGGMGFWTGGSDALEENEWIWTETGERLTLTGDWAPGEPDQTLGKNCLGLWGDHGFLLGAWECQALLQPICEISVEEGSLIG